MRTSRTAPRLRVFVAALGALVIGLTTLIGLVRPASASRETRVIDDDGVWTLDRLGHGSTPVPVDDLRTSVRIPFELPAGAAQGPDHYYQLELDFSIMFRSGVDDAVTVSALTQGRFAALIEFGFDDPPNPAPFHWGSANIDGSVGGSAENAEATVHFWNYLALGGVAPGENTLAVVLEQPEEGVVESLEVLESTAIIRSIDPFERLSARLRLGDEHPGDDVTLEYRLENRAGNPIEDVALFVYPAAVIERELADDEAEGATRSLPSAEPEQVVDVGTVESVTTGSFRYRDPPGGTHRLAVIADGDGSRPAEPTFFEFDTASDPDRRPALALALSAGLVGAALLLLGRRISRRSATD